MTAVPKKNPPCGLCGGPHPFDTTVPSVRWNAIIRARGLPEYLCLTCIVRSFVEAGESFTAELIGAAIATTAIEVRINSQDAKDALAVSEENTALRARIPEDAERYRWQPIETAPKDGTSILSFNSDRQEYSCMVVYWRQGWSDWFTVPGMWAKHPTHWMPLPAPPK